MKLIYIRIDLFFLWIGIIDVFYLLKLYFFVIYFFINVLSFILILGFNVYGMCFVFKNLGVVFGFRVKFVVIFFKSFLIFFEYI